MERKMPIETDAMTPKKIAIVTGGSRGIGRNTVESLARRGVNTIFTYHTHGTDAEAVVGAVNDAGSEAVALQLDAGNIASFDAFVESVKDALSKLGATRFDFLVNNAGNSHRNMPFATATEGELDSIYNVHFKGVFFLTQKLLPLINDGGRIVNVSTVRTRTASTGGAVYASMKGAVEVLSRHMALELGPRRIAVNVVAPGPVATDFSGGIVRDNPAVNKRIAENTALGRAGLPEDLGPMIAALLAEENHWVNAQRIEVSGGVAI
jgi:NAD(P)-dependent dehydrogenase (short-subunit alcohol dehydrogenase family)